MEDVSVIKPLTQQAAGAVRSLAPPAVSQKSGASERKVENPVSREDGAPFLGSSSSSQASANLAEVNEAVSMLNEQLAIAKHALRFQIDKTTDEIKVLVVDEETGKVVRTIPPEASVRLASTGQQSGLFTAQG